MIFQIKIAVFVILMNIAIIYIPINIEKNTNNVI